jgi:hypothetical protein
MAVQPLYPTQLGLMKLAKIWLVWKLVPQADGKKSLKVPYYVSGAKRSGQLDAPADRAKLVTYEEALRLFEKSAGMYAGLGIALGPDDSGEHWQGIDLDAVVKNDLGDIADRFTRGDLAGYGYVEQSPSGEGLHIIGRGRPYRPLGSNGSGIESYAGLRFFTFTGRPIFDSPCIPYDIADYVEMVLAPRHCGESTSLPPMVAETVADATVLSDLRSALLYMRADSRDLWVRMAAALKELGKDGRALWLWWSATSEKFEPIDAARVWNSVRSDRTGYQAVFAEATRQGWLNPRSRAAQASGKAAGTVVAEFQSRTPQNFLNTAVAPAIDLVNLPPPIAKFAAAIAAANGFDPSGVAMAAIAAAASMIDDGYVLEAKPGWWVSARLWVVLIGRSATGKSPTIKAATAPIKRLHVQLVAQFLAHYQPDKERPDERPAEPALFTSDATIEALSEKLRNNPRGLLMITEEFASWIGAIDATTRGDAAKNRGAWLQLYDGGAFQVDRITRGSFLVPNWSASLLTATTPVALAEHMKHLPEDGLIQRFIPTILMPRDFDVEGDVGNALQDWDRALEWIYSKVHPGAVQFSTEARALFRRAEVELGKMASVMDGISSALASHLGKHSEMVARVALVFHVFDWPASDVLSAVTLQKAIDVMAQVRRHSVALYTDILGRSPAAELARSLARSLAAAEPPRQTIGRDWMTQHCRDFERAPDDRTRREAVQLLEDLDWLKDVSERNYKGWPTKLEVNQNIYRLYARESEAHRAQRAAVKAVFTDTTEPH